MVQRLRIETSLERRGRSGWKELVPREHGLLGWLAVPLTAAIIMAATAGASASAALATVAGALAAMAGLGSAHGVGRVMSGAQSARRPATIALGLAYVLGALGVWAAARPGVMVLTLGLGGALGFGAMAFTRGRPPRSPAFEVAGIAALVALGAGLALAADVAADRVVAAALALAAWLVLGLWWVRGQLARALSNREAWRGGLVASAAATAASVGLGLALGHVVVGLLPLAYLARALVHRPPTSGKDAKRVGLTELGWGLAVAVLAAIA